MSSDGAPRVVERSTHAGPNDYRATEREREKVRETRDEKRMCADAKKVMGCTCV